MTSEHIRSSDPFTRLIGSWKLRHRDFNTKEEWGGSDTFEWLPGGRFLTFRHHEDGNGGIDGVMVIGNEMGWEVEGDIVQFWLTSKQSSMFFRGEFSKDGNTINGTWKWPGGGYDLVMKRDH